MDQNLSNSKLLDLAIKAVEKESDLKPGYFRKIYKFRYTKTTKNS